MSEISRVEIHSGVNFEEKLSGLMALCEGYDLFVLGENGENGDDEDY